MNERIRRSSKIEFVCSFFGRVRGYQKSFEIIWPLVWPKNIVASGKEKYLTHNSKFVLTCSKKECTGPGSNKSKKKAETLPSKSLCRILHHPITLADPRLKCCSTQQIPFRLHLPIIVTAPAPLLCWKVLNFFSPIHAQKPKKWGLFRYYSRN